MWFKKTILPVAAVLATSGLFAGQAQAFGDDEAAILVGVAVGGLTAYALKHANDHHHDVYYERREYREYREPPRRYCPPRRVERVVVYNPPQRREYERVSYREERGHHGNGHDKGRNGHDRRAF